MQLIASNSRPVVAHGEKVISRAFDFNPYTYKQILVLTASLFHNCFVSRSPDGQTDSHKSEATIQAEIDDEPETETRRARSLEF